MTSPPADDTVRSAERSQTRPGANRPDRESRGSSLPSRRGFLRTFGASALALGTASGVPAGAAQFSSDRRIEGIDDWSLTEERISADEVQDGPTVSYEDDTVVVTGSTAFSDGCGTFRIGVLAYSAKISRLGVVVETERTGEVCTEAMEPTRYELRVTASDVVQETVVEEAFTDAWRSIHPRNDHVRGVGDLPPEVEDYEFEWGDDVDVADHLANDEVGALEPAVRFEGSDVVVEGALVHGSSSCTEVGLATLGREHTVEGHVGLDVNARTAPTYVPGDPCTENTASSAYRLRLIGADEPPIQRCTAREDGIYGDHSITAEERDHDLALPDGVTDHQLVIEHSVEYDDRETAVRSDPSVTLESGPDDDVVAVEGTMEVGSNCDTIGVERVGWSGDESASELDVDLATGLREFTTDAFDCRPEGVTVDYRLELTVEQVPDVATGTERDDHADQPERSTTVEFDGSGGDSEYPPGVANVEVASGPDAHDRTVDQPGPNASFSEDGLEFVAYGDAFELVSLCRSVVLGGTEFDAAEEREHLLLALRYEYTGIPDHEGGDDCGSSSYAVPWEVRVTFEHELPRSVTLVATEADDTEQRTVFDRGHEPSVVAAVVDEYGFDDDPPSEPPAEPAVAFGDDGVSVESAVARRPCEQVAVERLAYDEAADELTVRVGTAYAEGRSPFGDCGDERATVPYSLAVDLAQVPSTVTVEEPDRDGYEATTVERDACERSATVAGETVCDVDGDGLYRDVNADGDVTHADVQAFFDVQHRPAWKQLDRFDFNGNEAVGHGDVAALFEYVAVASV